MAAEDQPNPMEEFLRQFGITPGPDGTFDLNQLMGPLQQAMQQAGSAKQVLLRARAGEHSQYVVLRGE